jgi:hypothetical protein
MSKRRSIALVVIGLLLGISVAIEVSYALWVTRIYQDSVNIVTTDCLIIELEDENDISLANSYPLTDKQAESLTPYTFTIKNVCSTGAYYTVNLEMMYDTNLLASKYIAVSVNGGSKKLLSNLTSTDPTYKDDNYTAIEARELIQNGYVAGNGSVSYDLRIWMDESVTTSDDVMNKTFTSKISVVASQEEQEETYASLADYFQNKALFDTTNLVADDGTDDHNLRYIGANPDNYLCFDEACTNGKWRVIGVMNNMTTSDGTAKSLVKIIRNESIDSLAWDSNNVNDWTTASLNTYLNGDWYTANLTDYDNLMESVVWNLGGYSNFNTPASTFFAYERNTAVYSGRPTEWTGKLALMYPSDYGYATSGGDTTDRATCLTYKLGYSSSDSTYWNKQSDCYGNDYLLDSSNSTWTLLPDSSRSDYAFLVSSGGYVSGAYVSYSYAVRPVGYLKSNTQILSGEGTSDNPWIVG